MKKVVIIILCILAICLLILNGCASKTVISESKPPTPLSASEQQILQQHPDDLDNALNELDTVG